MGNKNDVAAVYADVRGRWTLGHQVRGGQGCALVAAHLLTHPLPLRMADAVICMELKLMLPFSWASLSSPCHLCSPVARGELSALFIILPLLLLFLLPLPMP